MIWPGVISMGMPRSGVGGLGGELGAEMKVESEDSETGEVGSDTVMGGLGALKFRLKIQSYRGVVNYVQCKETCT